MKNKIKTTIEISLILTMAALLPLTFIFINQSGYIYMTSILIAVILIVLSNSKNEQGATQHE